MTPAERLLHEQAVADGFQAEQCPGCGIVLLAHHHFVICAREKQCAMTDGVKLLERMQCW